MNLTPSATEQMLQLIEEQIKCFSRMKELQGQITLIHEQSKLTFTPPLEKCDTDIVTNSPRFYKISLDEKDDHLLTILERLEERALELRRPAKTDRPKQPASSINHCTMTCHQRPCKVSWPSDVIERDQYNSLLSTQAYQVQDLVVTVDNLANENEQLAEEIHEIELCTEQIQARIYQLETWLTNRRRKDKCEWADRSRKNLQGTRRNRKEVNRVV